MTLTVCVPAAPPPPNRVGGTAKVTLATLAAGAAPRLFPGKNTVPPAGRARDPGLTRVVGPGVLVVRVTTFPERLGGALPGATTRFPIDSTVPPPPLKLSSRSSPPLSVTGTLPIRLLLLAD